jgi:hypothetical protein
MGVVDPDGGSAQRLWLLQVPGMIRTSSACRPPTGRGPETVDDGEVLMAVVRCPCGEQPIIETASRASAPARRLYLYFDRRRDRVSRARVYVTNSPKRPKPRWLQITDDWRRSSRSQS